jgi:hypothetical protein
MISINTNKIIKLRMNNIQTNEIVYIKRNSRRIEIKVNINFNKVNMKNFSISINTNKIIKLRMNNMQTNEINKEKQ